MQSPNLPLGVVGAGVRIGSWGAGIPYLSLDARPIYPGEQGESGEQGDQARRGTDGGSQLPTHDYPAPLAPRD